MVLPSVISPSRTMRSASDMGRGTVSMNSSGSNSVSPAVRAVAR